MKTKRYGSKPIFRYSIDYPKYEIKETLYCTF